MLVQKVLNIYDGKFQEEYMKWILFNFQLFRGWTRRLVRWTPETALRREDNSEASGYLIISWSPAAAAGAEPRVRGPAAGRARPPGGSCSPGGSWSSSFGSPGFGAAEEPA